MFKKAQFKGPKIVVIGGGTGSFTLLSGLKNYAYDITALVNMADDGGSTGVLRDELGALPPGDVRQCLVALSNSPRVRDLFNYRFEEGSLKGHAFGNLFLSALEKMTGDFAAAVELASEVLDISGNVEPVTLDNVTLSMNDSGNIIKGEQDIATARLVQKRPELWLEPSASLNPHAAAAIKAADMIVVAPGNLYGSLAPALLVDGMKEAIAATKAKKIYICNLVTKPGQTDGFHVHDFADEIERFLGGNVLDFVIYNTVRPNEKLFQTYAKEGEFLVEADEQILKKKTYHSIPTNILARQAWGGGSESDALAGQRSLIRHDSDKLARAIMKLYFE